MKLRAEVHVSYCIIECQRCIQKEMFKVYFFSSFLIAQCFLVDSSLLFLRTPAAWMQNYRFFLSKGIDAGK